MRTCFLCGRNGCGDPLDRHHIFGGSRRNLSEKYGAVVDLCHDRCHENGPGAAHRCAQTAQLLHEYGQRKVMREQGWTVEQFMAVFGKNYIDYDRDEGGNAFGAERRTGGADMETAGVKPGGGMEQARLDDVFGKNYLPDGWDAEDAVPYTENGGTDCHVAALLSMTGSEGFATNDLVLPF